ncbi:MAG: hypothetical protein QOE90_2778 [Thermoplasmata archaeon]|jgi:hypothetical protein|nr:hypothetical protein [Thermoplasmata archaeon]
MRTLPLLIGLLAIVGFAFAAGCTSSQNNQQSTSNNTSAGGDQIDGGFQAVGSGNNSTTNSTATPTPTSPTSG